MPPQPHARQLAITATCTTSAARPPSEVDDAIDEQAHDRQRPGRRRAQAPHFLTVEELGPASRSFTLNTVMESRRYSATRGWACLPIASWVANPTSYPASCTAAR